jgi:3-phosphoshikimate 1-carboxyvinyltransferase
MTTLRVRPGFLTGRVRAPSSKSYTHRALVAAHLSGRQFRVMDPLDSQDTRATANALRHLGSRVTLLPGEWVVEPDRRSPRPGATLDCGESGTTLRFLATVAARRSEGVRFSGRGRLPERPMGSLLQTLVELGASVEVAKSGLPIDIQGPIRGGRIRLDASTSSQFVSSVLMTLPTLAEDSRVQLTGPIVSAPYIAATLAVLRHHRVRVTRRGRVFSIPGGQRYRGARFQVPGDASSAAYLWALGSLNGSSVRVDGIADLWPQADWAILRLLRESGAEVSIGRASVTVSAGVRRPFTVDLTDSPDLYPLVGVLAATTSGTSRLVGAPHVVHKETDRRAGTIRLARAFGATVRAHRHGVVIQGTDSPTAVNLGDLPDHRLVMSAAVGALTAEGPSRLGPAEATRKSFPRFWEVLRTLGAEVDRT